MRKLHQLITATATLSILALHCSDPASPAATGGTPSTGGSTGGTSTGGTPSTGGTTGGTVSTGGTTGGTVSTGGTATGGTATGGTATGGSATGGVQGGGGAGGKSTGGGGQGGAATGGSGGAATGGSGGAAVTFAQVAGLLNTACAGAMCHGGGMQVNLTDMSGLYMRLTMPLPTTLPHCGGTTLVVPNNPTGSFLLSVVQGKATCMKGAGTESIARMPDNCSPTSSNPRACLTTTQVKLIQDWISGGAPM